MGGSYCLIRFNYSNRVQRCGKHNSGYFFNFFYRVNQLVADLTETITLNGLVANTILLSFLFFSRIASGSVYDYF